MIGLGCMRLSTRTPRDPRVALAVIHAALDAGATLLDTADAYALDEKDVGHNERLVAEALRSWPGDTARVTIATKGGLTRPGGKWVPDGRARHLRAACEASLGRLGVGTIDLYQLHAVDPRTPIETSVRALASLQREGRIRQIGLCNVNVSQIEAARGLVEIASVQVSLSPFDDENLRNGVAEYCRDQDIQLIAHRPLGGDRAKRLAQDPVLRTLAELHNATTQELALAWLLDLDPRLVPVPGATRVETAASLARVLSIRLSDDDRAALDARFPAGRLLRVPRAERQPTANAAGDVVLVMGPPGAGKSTVALELARAGYERLNRDSRGGRLSDLVTELDSALAAGRREFVLDNTYASRAARNEVVETAWRHRVPARCIRVDTPIADAQINAVLRLLEIEGRLPRPDELKKRGAEDHRYFGPDAQFRYERQLEQPVLAEGFISIERHEFQRRPHPRLTQKALVLEYDDVLCTTPSGAPAIREEDVRVLPDRKQTLARYAAEGFCMLAITWRPQIAAGAVSEDQVRACFDRTRELLAIDLDIGVCPHEAGPPVCWCRKPLPGLVLELAWRHHVAPELSLFVGRAPADRTLAARLGMRYSDAEEFFAPLSDTRV